jgi:hypothetical protein
MQKAYDPARRVAAPRLGAWVLAALALALIVAAQLAAPPPTHAGGDVGYTDFAFGPAQTTTPSSGFQDTAPTATKPQSKLWYNDGFWWGALLNGVTHVYDIYQFNWQTQSWTDTGVPIDTRATSHADCLWDAAAGYLYVATAVMPGDPGNADIHVRRYTYSAVTKTYTLDTDSIAATGGVEAVVLDKDSTGVIWVTYTFDTNATTRAVYVTHSASGGGFITPYVIPVAGAANLTSDDISAIIAFGGKTGVMWSNQNADAMYFAIHVDGAPDNMWQPGTAYAGPHYPDDHINLKSLNADPSGQVFAVIKTSLSDLPTPNPNDPLVVLLARSTTGTWSPHTVSTVQDNETRPIVLIDTTNREAYVFATTNTGQVPSAIYYKQSSVDSLNFPVGLGTPFIASAAHPNINNATSTKQNLTSGTGLLVLASDLVSGYYMHNVINLPGPSATPSPAPSQTGTATRTAAASSTATTAAGTATRTAIATATRTAVATATQTAIATATSRPLSPTATSTPCAISFSDVHPTDYFYTPVEYLACHGVISGYADGTFRPYTNTTRSQMVKIVVLAFHVPGFTPPAGYTFADVLPTNPFFSVIEAAAHANIVSGYACGGPGEPCDSQNRAYFRPYAAVTRGQLTKIVVVAASWTPINPATPTFADVAPNTAFYTFVETAYCKGVISGYTCGGPGEPCDSQNRPYFRQGANATRGQIAKIVYGALNAASGSCAPDAAAP